MPRQLANRPRAHPPPHTLSRLPHAGVAEYPVLPTVSRGCPGAGGRLPTCYSAVRHSIRAPKGALTVRLACVRRAASVRPEPGSNSLLNPLYQITTPKSNYLISFFNAYASLNYLCFQKYTFFISVRFSPHFTSKKSLRFLTSFCSYYCSIFKVLRQPLSPTA